MGCTDPDFINCVASSNRKHLIAAGDDENFISITNYPCISDNAPYKAF